MPMIHIFTAITVIQKMMLLLDATSAFYGRLKTILADLKARHAAGQRFTSADIFDDVEEMDAIDDDFRKLLAERRAAAGIPDAPEDYVALPDTDGDGQPG